LPHRFPQTDIVVLPIKPHGPIRLLHDAIATSGLLFGHARFTFSPHVTLNLYKTLTRTAVQELLQLRIAGPVTLDTLHVYYTNEPSPAKLLLELPLRGESVQSNGAGHRANRETDRKTDRERVTGP
jgi:hypothetical protein